MPSPDWIGQTLCVLYPFCSANSVATVGVRVYGWLRHSRWSHPCPANLVTLTAQKFRHLPFSKEVSHESVAGRPLWIRFTSTPCSFFELYVHCVRGLKRRFAWQVQRTSRTFSSTWQAWHFLHVAKMFAGVGQHERWFWRSCLVAGAVFRWTTFWKVRKHRFVKLSSVLISNMMIPCGGTSDASGSFFVAGAVLCRPRHKSGWDLGKRRCWHFWCSFFMVRAMFCESLTCARATSSSLCACRIALVVARFWDCSRNPLVTLCGSDCSRCGAVRILQSRNLLGTWGLSDRSCCVAGFFFEIPSALCACQIALAVARCSFHWVKEILRGDLDKEVFCREFAQRSWQEMSCLCRDLARRLLLESLYRDLAQRFCGRDLAKRPLAYTCLTKI